MCSDAAVRGSGRRDISKLAVSDANAPRQLDHLERQLRRFALDIHDSLAQSLCAAQLQVETIDVLSGDDDQRKQIAILRELIDHAIADVAEIVTELRPVAVDAEGIVAKLLEYRDQFVERTGLDVVVTVEGEAPELSPSAEIAAFRIVQESLNNTHKHAGASRADVHLSFSPETLLCRVSDDGEGFDVSTVDSADRRSNHGIRGMMERAALLDGTVEVSSAPGRGTTVTVRIPVWK